MNTVNSIVAVVTALVSLPGVSALIVQMTRAAKARADAKKISEDGHAKTQQMIKELKAGQADDIARLLDENAQLRAENEALKDRTAKLESKNGKLTAALPTRAS